MGGGGRADMAQAGGPDGAPQRPGERDPARDESEALAGKAHGGTLAVLEAANPITPTPARGYALMRADLT